MFIRLLFLFIVFYLLLKFIIRIVIPVVMATRNVQSKMKDINENMNDLHSAGQSSSSPNSGSFTKSQSKTSSGKEDYIDFEEIK